MAVSDGREVEKDVPANERGTTGRKNGGKRRAAAAVADARTDREVEIPRTKRGARKTRNSDLRELLDGLRALDAGDFRTRLTDSSDPLMREIVDVFNSVATKHERLSDELRRVSFSVGREGNMRERVDFPAPGSWGLSADAVNNLISDLVQPTTEVSRVIKAVAEGDLSQKVALDLDGRSVRGEFARIATIVLGVAAIAIAYLVPNVLDLILYAYTFGAAGLFFPMLGLLFWRRTTARGAFWSMLAGGGSAVVWAALGEPYGFAASYAGWLIGLPVLVVVSLLTEHSPDEDLQLFYGPSPAMRAPGGAPR